MYWPNKEKAEIVRKKSNNNYIYKAKNKTSFGYFYATGNLVLESYDVNTDKGIVKTFIMVKE